VCICSLPCPDSLNCLVCDAARATSAAPTFFPVQKINDRLFADGGMEFNNPSHEIFDHYTRRNRVAESRRTSVATEAAVLTELHGSLDFSEVRFINLGTGTEPNIAELCSQSNFAVLVPGALRMALFLKRNLTKMATNSERVAGAMRTIAHVSSSGNIRTQYERFSADNGVCFIKMDKYKKLAKIESLTLEYLRNDVIQRKLSRVAEEIAGDYLAKHSMEAVTTAPGRLAVPAPRTGRPQTPVSQPLPTSPQSPETPSSTRQSTDNSETSADNTSSKHSSTEATSTAPSSVVPSPSRQISNMGESMLVGGLAHIAPVLAS
jgi:Patatin-like phospholipase